jgi:hypothetical protein
MNCLRRTYQLKCKTRNTEKKELILLRLCPSDRNYDIYMLLNGVQYDASVITGQFEFLYSTNVKTDIETGTVSWVWTGAEQ